MKIWATVTESSNGHKWAQKGAFYKSDPLFIISSDYFNIEKHMLTFTLTHLKKKLDNSSPLLFKTL